jgi:sterol desaturase/sphingolipid hydroxylase (fatty acid hydroxylase superfamily)
MITGPHAKISPLSDLEFGGTPGGRSDALARPSRTTNVRVQATGTPPCTTAMRQERGDDAPVPWAGSDCYAHGPRQARRHPVNPTKRIVFVLLQPLTLALIVLFWAVIPASLLDQAWVVTAVSLGTLAFVQTLEFVNERHAGWRLTPREFLTDLFYLILYYVVIEKLGTKLADDPMASAKHALGITTQWAMHLPFLAQVALAVVLIEVGQYWMHRLMHNSFLWWTHAPHHHITQLNALKGFVGNPLELFLVSLSVLAFFDLRINAVFCAFNVLGAVAAFAHANVRFDPPRWYSYFFTTVEAHSLHHSVAFLDTRCNYANSLILCDRVFGTFRQGEAQVVGQDDRKRLAISQQFLFPLRPLMKQLKPGPGTSATA